MGIGKIIDGEKGIWVGCRSFWIVSPYPKRVEGCDQPISNDKQNSPDWGWLLLREINTSRWWIWFRKVIT